MSEKYSYETVLVKGPFKGTYADFPFDSAKIFGTRKHIWVKIEVEGKTFSMNLLPNGKGGHWLHLKKEIRDAIGKREGDTVAIHLQKDNKPRTVTIPDYLQWLLEDDKEMALRFEKLPISAKTFWTGYIEEPKNDDVKVDRINKLFQLLREQNTKK